MYFDNFYTSPSLCERLHTMGFGCCGTVRLDRRNIPDTFKSAILKKGEIATFHDDELFGLKWKDKRVVSLLSTIHDDTMISKERRSRQAPGGVETIQKPLIIEDYNQYMGGVDKSDQLYPEQNTARSEQNTARSEHDHSRSYGSILHDSVGTHEDSEITALKYDAGDCTAELGDLHTR